jgi:hypothetical protein
VDMFAILLAALAHDMGHTGQNNTFHINAMTAVALRYNDKSVLENNSAAMLFEFITQSCPLTNYLSPADFKSLRVIMVTCILDTDMSNHDLLQSRFVSLLTSLSFDKSSLDDRKLLCSVILHAADLSNPTRRFSQAFEWAERLGDEFQYQVDLEQSLGLPVAPFMLKVKEKLMMAKNETFFIRAYVEPLYVKLCAMFPEICLRLTNLTNNLSVYRKIIDQEENPQSSTTTGEPASGALLVNVKPRPANYKTFTSSLSFAAERNQQFQQQPSQYSYQNMTRRETMHSRSPVPTIRQATSLVRRRTGSESGLRFRRTISGIISNRGPRNSTPTLPKIPSKELGASLPLPSPSPLQQDPASLFEGRRSDDLCVEQLLVMTQ